MADSSVSHDLWGAFPLPRVRAAQSLSPRELQDETERLLGGCPSKVWPYGCSTSINPWIVFLGPSPGASHAAGDTNYVTRIGIPPTAGTPPSSMVYPDSRGFFERLRSLTVALIGTEAGPSISHSDALALSGMMNLDNGACGDAHNVRVDANFARWVLDVSIRRLMPRYVVGVGLGSFLREPRHRWLLDLFSMYVGASFVPDRAPVVVPFEAYRQKQYVFRAWPLQNGGLKPQHFIMLPQHPCRAPMTSPAVWADTVREFVALTRGL